MNNNPMIEFLYFEGCPSWKMAQESLEKIIRKHNIEATVQLVQVETDQEARDHRFVGSPSIRVDGKDLFPVDHENYALGCRVYQTPDGMRGWPIIGMLEDALTARLS